MIWRILNLASSTYINQTVRNRLNPRANKRNLAKLGLVYHLDNQVTRVCIKPKMLLSQ